MFFLRLSPECSFCAYSWKFRAYIGVFFVFTYSWQL